MKTETQIEEINARVETARAAYAAATEAATTAYAAAVAAATAAHTAFAAATDARAAYNDTRKTNMTKEKLEEILAKVWMRDWSADDACDAIWGETFSGYTQPIPEEPEVAQLVT